MHSVKVWVALRAKLNPFCIPSLRQSHQNQLEETDDLIDLITFVPRKNFDSS